MASSKFKLVLTKGEEYSIKVEDTSKFDESIMSNVS